MVAEDTLQEGTGGGAECHTCSVSRAEVVEQKIVEERRLNRGCRAEVVKQ